MSTFLKLSTAASLRDEIYQVDGIGKDRKERILSGTQQLVVLEETLLGWNDNFVVPKAGYDGMAEIDDNGNIITAHVAFDPKRKREMIEMVPAEIRDELVEFVKGESSVTEGEAKS